MCAGQGFRPLLLLAAIGILIGVGARRDGMAQDASPVILFDASQTRGDFESRRSTLQKRERAVAVTTQPDQPYPGIVWHPDGGEVDLSDWGGIRCEVSNPGSDSLKVILAVENQGSTGREGSNAMSRTLAAGQKVTLDLPFGVWHGNSTDSMDPSKVARVVVMIDPDQPSRTFLVHQIATVPTEPMEDIDEIMASDYFGNLKPFFGRGINVGNTLEAPREGEWGRTLKLDQLNLIKQAGFDSIRLPVRWSTHAMQTSPYTIDPAWMERVRTVVNAALALDLKVVLNVHHYDAMAEQPQAHRERLRMIWRQIAAQFAGAPDGLAFEIMNEPHGALSADLWNEMLAENLREIRRQHPERFVVVGPANWNSIAGLRELELPDDDHLVVTVHYYSPFEFTHQGASWVGEQSQAWQGTDWTGSDAELADIERDFDTALRFGYRHNVPIYLGEFGAYSEAPMPARARWTRAVAQQAMKRKMGYAYWEFYSGFGVYDPESRQWKQPLLDALLNPAG